MKHWTLPRKAKKAFVALHGRGAYRVLRRANDLVRGVEDRVNREELQSLCYALSNVATAAKDAARGLRKTAKAIEAYADAHTHVALVIKPINLN